MKLQKSIIFVICKKSMYLVFLLFIFIPGYSYSANSKCAKTIRKGGPSPKKNEIARLSRVNFVHNAVESIINNRILSYSQVRGFVSSIRNRNLNVWVKRLEEQYENDQSFFSFEMFDSLLTQWDSKVGKQTEKLERPDHSLIFVEKGKRVTKVKKDKGMTKADKETRERKIQRLKEMAQWYNEGNLLRLNQIESSHNSRFSNSIKMIMFAYWLKLPPEQIQELIVTQLKKERQNHNLASYIRRSLNLYPSFDQTKSLAKEEDSSPENRKVIQPALQTFAEKEDEFFEEMGLFLLALIEKMDPALLKNLIMQDLFLLLKMHTV